MTGKSTETADPSSWKFKVSRLENLQGTQVGPLHLGHSCVV